VVEKGGGRRDTLNSSAVVGVLIVVLRRGVSLLDSGQRVVVKVLVVEEDTD
jgi:hypothetical protein